MTKKAELSILPSVSKKVCLYCGEQYIPIFQGPILIYHVVLA